MWSTAETGTIDRQNISRLICRQGKMVQSTRKPRPQAEHGKTTLKNTGKQG